MNADHPVPVAAIDTCIPSGSTMAGASLPNPAGGCGQQGNSEVDGLKQLLEQARTLWASLSDYLTTSADRIGLLLRHLSLHVVLAMLGFVAVAGLIVMASWLMLSGIADGLGVLFGSRPWAGKIIAGALLLAVLTWSIRHALSRRSIASRERTVQKYAKRQADDEARSRRSAGDPANAQPNDKRT